jgi:MFS family permease
MAALYAPAEARGTICLPRQGVREKSATMNESRLGKFLGINGTILALSIARMADGIANSILFVMIPLYAAKLPDKLIHLPLPLIVGVLIAAYGVAAAGLQPVTATLVDRMGHHKRFIQAGLVLICLATLAFILAVRYLDLLGLRIAQGCGLALEIPSTMALMAILTRRESRGASMGFYTTMRMLGLALGPLAGGLLHDRLGFNAAFYTAAAILLLAVLVVQFGVANVQTAEMSSAGRKHRFIDPSLVTSSIVSAGFATFIVASAFTLITTLENEFNSRLSITAFGFATAFSALMIGRIVFQLPLGKLSDRFGRKPFVLFGLLLLAPVTAFLGEVTTLLEFILLRFIQGLAAAAIIAPALALAGDEARAGGHGRQMSIVTMGFGWGIAFGPLLAGVLSIYSFKLPFWASGGLSLIGAVVVIIFMSETVPKRDADKSHD